MTHGDITSLYDLKRIVMISFPKLAEADIKEIMEKVIEKVEALEENGRG